MKAKQRDQNKNNDSHATDSRQNENKFRKRKSEGENQTPDNAEVNREGKVESRITGGASKKRKTNPKPKKPSQEDISGGSEQKGKGFKANRKNQQIGKTPSEVQKTKPSEETNTRPKKRRMQDPKNAEEEDNNLHKRKKPSKNKDALGRDHIDKLDMLIERYRSKYSEKSSTQADGERKGSGQLRKWFKA